MRILPLMTTRPTTALWLSAAALSSLLLFAGCGKTADNTLNYKSALDNFYAAHPSCLWNTSQKFPVQIGASNETENAPYAALVDQGMLVRSTSEKKILIISKQEINYDLSDSGRSAWTADPNMPGYGNFCYGHRSVSSITSSTPNDGQPGATTTVDYQYRFTGAPSWTQSAEIQNAFPQLKTDLAGAGAARATLTDTPNGWQVSSAPPVPAHSSKSSPADGSIVQ